MELFQDNLTWEYKENPGCHFTGCSETAKVEFSDGHSNGVLNGVWKVVKVPQISTENKVEETAEGSKDDYKFDHKGRKADETELDRRSNLTESLLEAG